MNHSRWKQPWLYVAAGSAAIVVIAVFLWLAGPSRRSLVPYPLVLVHGFGGSGDIWTDKYQVVSFFERRGLRFGGILSVDASGRVQLDRERPGYDFYAVTFSDHYDSIERQTRELARFVETARRRSRAEAVVLVGYSMGGVTARAYLVNHRRDSHVRKLITIGSPHSGTPLATLYDLRRWLEYWHTHEPEGWTDHLGQGAAAGGLATLSGLESLARSVLHNDRFNLTLPAVADMRPPRRCAYGSYRDGLLPGTTYLERLNTATHPLGVEYACVIGEISLDDSLAQVSDRIKGDNPTRGDRPGILSAIGYPLGNAALRLIGSSADSANLFDGGDGVIDTASQDLSQVAFFRRYPGRVKVLRVDGVGHLEECWHHEAIARAVGAKFLTLR